MNKFFPRPPNQTDFHWSEHDFSEYLPVGWDEAILEFARNRAVHKLLTPTSVTSREGAHSISLPTLTAGGIAIRDGLRWLYDLYHGRILEIAQSITADSVCTAKDDRYAINLNVQTGQSMRYEAHIDSNPIEGLLYVTSHPEGAGGELVVGLDIEARGVDEISRDCVRIYPEKGKLIFFDARRNPHFVSPLVDENDMRVVVAMNFYTPYCTELDRPADLNKHLGLE
jgi:2OG-Fe(II) oxygenase superfamily